MVKFLVFCLVLVLVGNTYRDIYNNYPKVVFINSVNNELVSIKTYFLNRGLGPKKSIELSEALINAYYVTKICPFFLLSLMITENNRFDPNIVSSAGYGSYMQTDKWTKIASVDILYGAEKLKYFLKVADGDIVKATAYYKGGLRPGTLAWRQANHVLEVYRNLKIDGTVINRI